MSLSSSAVRARFGVRVFARATIAVPVPRAEQGAAPGPALAGSIRTRRAGFTVPLPLCCFASWCAGPGSALGVAWRCCFARPSPPACACLVFACCSSSAFQSCVACWPVIREAIASPWHDVYRVCRLPLFHRCAPLSSSKRSPPCVLPCGASFEVFFQAYCQLGSRLFPYCRIIAFGL